MSRVVITGVGVVSPIGNTKEEFWNSLMEGKHGFTLEQWFPGQSEELNVKASVKDFSADGLLTERSFHKSTRYKCTVCRICGQQNIKDKERLQDLEHLQISVIIWLRYERVWKQRRKNFSHITTRATREFRYSLSPR